MEVLLNSDSEQRIALLRLRRRAVEVSTKGVYRFGDGSIVPGAAIPRGLLGWLIKGNYSSNDPQITWECFSPGPAAVEIEFPQLRPVSLLFDLRIPDQLRFVQLAVSRHKMMLVNGSQNLIVEWQPEADVAVRMILATSALEWGKIL